MSAVVELATRSEQDSQTLGKIAQGLESLNETLSRPEPEPRTLGQHILDVFRGDPK